MTATTINEPIENSNAIKIKKCPVDNKIRRVYINRQGKRELVVSDGTGHAFSCNNSLFGYAPDFIKGSNFIHPITYEFVETLKEFEV